MALSAYYKDPRNETRRRVFVNLALAQLAPYGAKPETDTWNFLTSVRDRFAQVMARFDREAGGRAELDPNRLLKDFLKEYWRNREDYDAAPRRGGRPALHRLARQLRDMRRTRDVSEEYPDWQSVEAADLADPNAVLVWYLKEIDDVCDIVLVAYEQALGEHEFDIHVNFTFGLKTGLHRDRGATNGVTTTPAPGSERNPCPAEREVERSACVSLLLPAEFDTHAAFMLAYTAAHELGVHVFQQLGLEGGPTRDPGFWVFSEGFMDCVITALIQSRLVRPGEADRLRLLRSAAAGERNGTRLVRELPSAATGNSELEEKWRAQLMAGRRAWDELKILADTREAQDVNAEDWAFNVALKLNALPLSAQMRDQFLAELQECRGYLPEGRTEREVLAEIEAVGVAPVDCRPFYRIHKLLSQVYELTDREYLAERVEDMVAVAALRRDHYG